MREWLETRGFVATAVALLCVSSGMGVFSSLTVGLVCATLVARVMGKKP